MFSANYLDIKTDRVDGNLIFSATGLLAPIAQPYLDSFASKLNRRPPIHIRNENQYIYSLEDYYHPSELTHRLIERQLKRWLFKITTPTACTLAVTYACPCDCMHCSADHKKDNSKKVLSTEEMKSVLDQLQDLGAYLCIFTGGEPLVRKDIFELVDYLDKDRCCSTIFTSGILLTNDNVKKLADAGLHGIQISFDHPDPDEHDKLRGKKGLYKKALEGAYRSIENGLVTAMSTYASNSKMEDGSVERMIQLAYEHGFHQITIFDYVPTGKLFHKYDEILTDENRQKLIDMSRKYQKLDRLMGVFPQSLVNSPRKVGCFAANTQFHMTSYGDINPCDFTPISFGNIRNETLEDIWKKMIKHVDFNKVSIPCRMQNAKFREKYFDILPDDIQFPIPIEQIHEQWKEKNVDPDMPTVKDDMQR